MFVAGVFAVLIFKQPDMGTMGIVVALMLVMYVIAGIPVSQIVKVVGAGLVGLIGLALLAPYRVQRFLSWLDPWKDAQGSGLPAGSVHPGYRQRRFCWRTLGTGQQ